MITINVPTLKMIEDLVPGELCKLQLGQKREKFLAIFITKTESNTFVLGVLDGAPEKWRIVELQAGKRCISFGTDWAVEAGHCRSWAMTDDDNFENSSGLIVSESGLLFAFSINEYGSYHHYSTSNSFNRAELGAFIGILTKFRIWASESDRNNSRAEPILEI